MENFPDVPFTRVWLESLSTSELIKLADDIGIDIPPGLERIFIIEELLLESIDISEQNAKNELQNMSFKDSLFKNGVFKDDVSISNFFKYTVSIKNSAGIKEDLQINPSYMDPVALPKQYNISFIDVIIRDPLWVYVYWEIKGHEREIHENANDFSGYNLRIFPLNEEDIIPKSKENSFTISINTHDSARYLGFTHQPIQEFNRYIIKLGAIRGDSELQIALSQPFRLPMLGANDTINKEYPLVNLSGFTDFATIKSTDRESRIMRQNPDV